MLKVDNLYKSYKTNHVLKGLNLELKKGDLKCLIGLNGSGKTTLIECVCGVKKFDSGSICINGINILDKKQFKKIKGMFGYMPQSFAMFNDLNVYENLAYVAAVYKLSEKRIDEVISMCKLDIHKNTLAGNLSGGYRQLLNLACAVMHQPELLILDEPTSAMDPLFRKKFWEIIHNYHKKGNTILVITHYVEEVNECKKFMCLNDGKLIFDGDIKDFTSNGIIDIEEILKTYTGDGK